jgi:hypothetical protein
MFSIEVSEGGRKHRVVDPDAGVSLEWLVAGGHISPRFLAWIAPTEAFPSRLHARKVVTLIRTFADDFEKLRWMKTATEALLVFGWAYTGLNPPHPRYVRVQLNGQSYTLEDFGYTLKRIRSPGRAP